MILSEKQILVLQLAAEGKSNWEIGVILQRPMGKYTITNTFKRIYTKLNVHNRIQAVTQALRLGLIK